MSKKLINDPDNLIAELIEGMVSAHPNHLTVKGKTNRAIVALNGPRDGKVGIPRLRLGLGLVPAGAR